MISTCTKVRPIDLRAHEVICALDRRAGQFRRVVSHVNCDVVRSCWDRLVWEDEGVPVGRQPAVVPDESWYGPGDGYAKVMERPHPDDPDDEDLWTRQRVPSIWKPGARLWARESFFDEVRGDEHFVAYRATNEFGDAGIPWKSPIVMPRWASRLAIEVVSVRVERLQKITTDNCLDEGVYCALDGQFAHKAMDRPGKVPTFEHADEAYRDLWNSLNVKRGCSWDSNPFVWRAKFKLMEEQA